MGKAKRGETADKAADEIVGFPFTMPTWYCVNAMREEFDRSFLYGVLSETPTVVFCGVSGWSRPASEGAGWRARPNDRLSTAQLQLQLPQPTPTFKRLEALQVPRLPSARLLERGDGSIL
ncbi:hypothetical protein DTO164E3_3614 [Paecilomyces variotii]|nr:hypothetical protein DTO164E3_3614 [Paecilomyces variotii]KAJ9356587.1 hypothetical protein DTO027B9_3441 [Paecilomyces variotii]